MMKLFLLFILFNSLFLFSKAQSYTDSIKTYQSNYVNHHEVVKEAERKNIHFFSPDENYRRVALVQLKESMPWFAMTTSGKMKKIYRVYAVISFTVNDTLLHLNLYQSQALLQSPDYKEYLFLPFTDATTGIESYEGGRYIDLKMDEIKNGKAIIDFNKAYNPYCAYVSGVYNCPVPPAENNLPIAITAGERKFSGH